MTGKFTAGMVAGGILAAAGISWLMADERTRRRVWKDGKRAMRKAGEMF